MAITLTGGDVLTIVSTAVTVIALGWGVYERVSAVSARKEVAKFRRLLILQQIAQQFSPAPARALALFRAVKTLQWNEGAETALVLSADLASLSGARQHVVGRLDNQVLQTALQVISDVNRLIPRTVEPIAEEMVSRLMDACNVILVSVSAIERSLSTSAALGGDYDGDTAALNQIEPKT